MSFSLVWNSNYHDPTSLFPWTLQCQAHYSTYQKEASRFPRKWFAQEPSHHQKWQSRGLNLGLSSLQSCVEECVLRCQYMQDNGSTLVLGGTGFAGSEQLRQVWAAWAPLGPPPRTACHMLPFGFYTYEYHWLWLIISLFNCLSFLV